MLGVMFVGAACLAIARRGAWYDEFYSFYLVRPAVAPGVLVPEWLRDNHPPLFYGLAWAWSRLLGAFGAAGCVESLRTLNLAILAVTVAMFAWMARVDPWFRRLVWYYLIALAAMFPALDRIDQLRSYFLSLALTAIVVPLLLRNRHRLALGIVLTLACSVHLITTVIVASLVAARFGKLVLARRWHDAGRLALIGALALVPFALFMAVQLPTIMGNTRHFWIPPGFSGARWAIEAELQGAIGANPLLSLAALGGAVLLALRWRRNPSLGAMATLAAGFCLALVVLVAAHIHRPLLITRYLVALDPIVALMLALGAERLAARWPLKLTIAFDAVLLIATGFAIHSNYNATIRQWSWNGSSQAIATLVRQCPSTLVYPDFHWNAEPLGMPPPENLQVVPFSYVTMAHRYGFALAPTGSHDLSRDCPTVFWADHAALFHPTANDVIRELRAAGYPVTSGRMVRHDIGWILITPPASPAPRRATARHAQSG